MNAQDMPIGSTTTTEELIVQYLDGELMRKELEMVLFERLATNEEARQLLREHLMLRGAIRHSMHDDRFQLSADLDDRTRTRIEEVLKAIPAQTAARDAAPARLDPAKRRLERWSVRPAYATLALLFAIGATWFLTHSTDTNAPHVAMKSSEPAQNYAASQPTATTSPSNTNAVASDAASNAAKVIVRERIVEKPVIKYVTMPNKHTSDLASNTATNPASDVKEQSEPKASDIMISSRFGKLLKETTKQEVVVTSHDRL